MKSLWMVVLCSLVGTLQANAQAIWSPPPGGKFGFDLHKLMIEDETFKFNYYSATLRGRFPAGKTGMSIDVELPVAHGQDYVFPDGLKGITSVGNPYAGIDAPLSSGVRIQAGLRLGIMSDDGESASAAFSGILAEFDRFEAYSPKTTSMRAVVHGGAVPDQGPFVQARGGFTLMHPSEGDNESLFDYGGRFGYVTGNVLVHGGLIGRLILSEDGSVGDRSSHQFVLGVSGTKGTFRPEFSLRRFVDSDLDNPDFILELGFTIGGK